MMYHQIENTHKEKLFKKKKTNVNSGTKSIRAKMKNSLENINTRFEQAEERTCALEHRTIGMIWSEDQGGKKEQRK